MADRAQDDGGLAAGFPEARREEWLALVEGVLKGASFERRLVSRSADGIRIEPLYDAADAPARPGRAAHGPWRVVQRVDDPRPQAANAQALEDLDGGADGLVLVWPEAASSGGFGIAAETVEDLDRILAGAMLDLVHVRLDAGAAGRQAAALFVALAERRGHALADLSIDLALDPIGAAAAAGRFSAPWEVVAARTAQTVGDLGARGFRGRALLCDGRPVHEAGASEAQELAFVVGAGVAYLRALEAGGVGLDEARRALAFLLCVDADQLLGIAKLRALRALWARVEEACGLDPAPIALHAETSRRMATRRDPWVNLLRGTVAAFSAGIGGADGVVVAPFTAALGLPDAFARRVARNTQHVLLHESNLWRVSDPAAGSGAVEALTDRLCETAWGLFQEIEREGGIVAALAAGAVQTRVAATRAARDAAIATRRAPITGTSEFPHLSEAPVSVALATPPPRAPAAAPHEGADAPPVAAFADLVAAAAAGRPRAALAPAPGAGTPGPFPPLPARRDAEPFERLRDRSDAILAERGARPRVFLATIGPLAAFNARATFARNAFEAGGIEAAGGAEHADAAALAEAFRASGAPIACLCSSDALYETEAESAARALKAAGARALYLAGRPGSHEAAWADAGVDAYVGVGVDLLALLEGALDRAAG